MLWCVQISLIEDWFTEVVELIPNVLLNNEANGLAAKKDEDLYPGYVPQRRPTQDVEGARQSSSQGGPVFAGDDGVLKEGGGGGAGHAAGEGNLKEPLLP